MIKVRERYIETSEILMTRFVFITIYLMIVHANMIFCEKHNLPNEIVVFF